MNRKRKKVIPENRRLTFIMPVTKDGATVTPSELASAQAASEDQD